MTGPLDGRVAVISGGTQGLGEAVARRFAARGAAGIMITGRNAERGEAVARYLSGGGCPAVFHQVELGDPAQVASVVPAADEAFGTLRLPEVCSIIQPENAASVRVAERLGLTCRRRTTVPASDVRPPLPVGIYTVTREEWSARA